MTHIDHPMMSTYEMSTDEIAQIRSLIAVMYGQDPGIPEHDVLDNGERQTHRYNFSFDLDDWSIPADRQTLADAIQALNGGAA